MGTTKKDIFSEEQNELANLAKAIGHPARIAILEHLVTTDSCICGDLVLKTKLAQATVSQHLKELKNAGLIRGIISGPSTCYCINPEKWEYVQEKFALLFASYTSEECC